MQIVGSEYIADEFLGPQNTIRSNMAELAEAVLRRVEETDGIDTQDLAKELEVDHQKVVGALKSIQCLGDVSCRRMFW